MVGELPTERGEVLDFIEYWTGTVVASAHAEERVDDATIDEDASSHPGREVW
jgi:hypothetical protein